MRRRFFKTLELLSFSIDNLVLAAGFRHVLFCFYYQEVLVNFLVLLDDRSCVKLLQYPCYDFGVLDLDISYVKLADISVCLSDHDSAFNVVCTSVSMNT